MTRGPNSRLTEKNERRVVVWTLPIWDLFELEIFWTLLVLLYLLARHTIYEGKNRAISPNALSNQVIIIKKIILSIFILFLFLLGLHFISLHLSYFIRFTLIPIDKRIVPRLSKMMNWAQLRSIKRGCILTPKHQPNTKCNRSPLMVVDRSIDRSIALLSKSTTR